MLRDLTHAPYKFINFVFYLYLYLHLFYVFDYVLNK